MCIHIGQKQWRGLAANERGREGVPPRGENKHRKCNAMESIGQYFYKNKNFQNHLFL